MLEHTFGPPLSTAAMMTSFSTSNTSYGDKNVCFENGFEITCLLLSWNKINEMGIEPPNDMADFAASSANKIYYLAII